MRLEDVTAEIRPRSDWEAVDLGFAMARRSFWRCLSVWWLALLLPTVVGIVLLRDHAFVFATLFWWWRPVASRMVLFELSRRLFGEAPTWRQIWKEIPRAWSRRFFYRFAWSRFSPWAAVTMPVEDLEGLRGQAYQQRAKLVMRRGESAAFRLTVGGSLASVWLMFGLLGMVNMLLPEGQNGVFQEAWQAMRAGELGEIGQAGSWILVGCYLVALSLTDIFVTGGGFGIYVNSRTWIEGWDVELAFKRMANRIGMLSKLLVASCFLFLQLPSGATVRPPEEVIREVKSHPDFEVHKTEVPVPVDSSSKGGSSSSSSTGGSPGGSTSPSPGGSMDWFHYLMRGFGTVLLVVCLVAGLAFIAWLLWTFRHLLRDRSGSDGDPSAGAKARVVMGMEVTPESLPEDIPDTAWRWWCEGRRHESLALLYRGAISRSIELARVEILESDTEGDCLKRICEAGSRAHPGYFKGLTGFWLGLAYAKDFPDNDEVQGLCRQWPYAERRQA
jgi:hypothetical protein